MKFTQTVARFSIKKLLTEKWQLAMFLIIPLMMAGLFSLITSSGGQVKPVGTLLITDADKSTLSQLLINGFKQGPMAEMFISKNVSQQEGQKLMDKGEASVWISIEEGFAQNFLDEKPTVIKLVKNPSQNILPEIAETAVELMADGGHYLQLLFAKELKQFNALLKGGGMTDAQMAIMSVQVKQTVESLQNQLFPPQIQAKKQQITKTNTQPKKSFMMLMFPGVLFMSLLFAAQGMALEFWKDKTQGITRRLLSTPTGLLQYLNGKLSASLFVYGLIVIVIGGLGIVLLKLNIQILLITIMWTILSGLVLGSMMLLVCLLMPTEKSASIVTSAMVFPLMMLGGSFFPFDTMPKWMVAIGQLLPNGYLLSHFNQWFIHDESLSVLLMPAIVACGFIVALWFINYALLAKFVRR